MADTLAMEGSVSVASTSSLHLSFSSSPVESLSETSDTVLAEEQEASGTVEPYLYETSEDGDSSEGTVESDDSLQHRLENTDW